MENCIKNSKHKPEMHDVVVSQLKSMFIFVHLINNYVRTSCRKKKTKNDKKRQFNKHSTLPDCYLFDFITFKGQS